MKTMDQVIRRMRCKCHVSEKKKARGYLTQDISRQHDFYETIPSKYDVCFYNRSSDDVIATTSIQYSTNRMLSPTTLTLVFKHNNLTFKGDSYLDINGTVMGTKIASSYANMFMGRLEKQILEPSPQLPISWFRFI